MVLPVTNRNSRRVTEKGKRQAHKKRCEICRTTFKAGRADAHYCSAKCRQRAARKRASAAPGRASKTKPAPTVHHCPQCSNPFVTAAMASLYCSPKCRQAAYRQRRQQAIAAVVAELVARGYRGPQLDKAEAMIKELPLGKLNKALSGARTAQA